MQGLTTIKANPVRTARRHLLRPSARLVYLVLWALPRSVMTDLALTANIGAVRVQVMAGFGFGLRMCPIKEKACEFHKPFLFAPFLQMQINTTEADPPERDIPCAAVKIAKTKKIKVSLGDLIDHRN